MVMFQDLESPDHRKKVCGRDEAESLPLPSESSLFLQVPSRRACPEGITFGKMASIVCAGHMFILDT